MIPVKREWDRLKKDGWDMETTFIRTYIKQYARNREAERTGEKVECKPCNKKGNKECP